MQFSCVSIIWAVFAFPSKKLGREYCSQILWSGVLIYSCSRAGSLFSDDGAADYKLNTIVGWSGHGTQSQSVETRRRMESWRNGLDVQESFLMAVYYSHCHGFALFNVKQERQKILLWINNENSSVLITTFIELECHDVNGSWNVTMTALCHVWNAGTEPHRRRMRGGREAESGTWRQSVSDIRGNPRFHGVLQRGKQILL